MDVGGHGGSGGLVRFRLAMYALVLVASAQQTAVVPLLPAYAHRFAAAGLGQGLLLAALGIGTLASLPAGLLSDRIGGRRLTLLAGAVMGLAMLLEALAPAYSWLLVSRLVFGIGFGILWTSGLAWLASASPTGAGLGATVATSGIGSMAGPAFAGLAAQYLGLSAPFLVAAAALAVLTMVLAGAGPSDRATRQPADRTPGLRPAITEVATVVATAAVVLATLTVGTSNLVAPRLLHAAGAPLGTIGLAFSASAVIFIAGSAVTASVGRRAVRAGVALAAMAALTVALAPAVLSPAPGAVVAMLCLTSGARSVLWTVAYQLGAAGARRAGAGVGTVMGLLNLAWAATAVLAPLTAGAVVDTAGARGTFGLAATVCVLVVAVVAAGTAWRRGRPGVKLGDRGGTGRLVARP